MGEHRRFDIFCERHFGVGLRWEFDYGFWLAVSLALPFVTITVGIGPRTW